MMLLGRKLTLFLFFMVASSIYSNPTTSLDPNLKNAMITYKVPVVGYAIIDKGKIVSSNTISIDNKATSKNSLFQAASISKSLAAFSALYLASKGKLNINDKANTYLKNWKIPDNHFTQQSPVLVKNLLDMTSGISVSGFAGYLRGKSLPSNIEILNGSNPANNKPISVFYEPGSKYFYSGGGFQVLQQIISDITKQSYDHFLNHTLLPKIGMLHSIYQYPLTNTSFLKNAVVGYQGWNNQVVPKGWHNYACAGAGGLWSTPTDLAKFALSITNAYVQKNNLLVNKKLAHDMLTRHNHTSYGYGLVVAGKGKGLYFWKAGHNYGYHSLLFMFPNIGKGVVIMTNSETGDTVIHYLVALIAHKYHWPYYFPFFDELIKTPAY